MAYNRILPVTFGITCLLAVTGCSDDASDDTGGEATFGSGPDGGSTSSAEGPGPMAMQPTFPIPVDASTELVDAPDYTDGDVWLCLPGADGNTCLENIDATVVNADGSTSTESFTANLDAPADCFYVYPTVSTDPGVSADLTAGQEEFGVVRQQVARLGGQCRVFAPLYRQVTLAGILNNAMGESTHNPAAVAYEDVEAAFDEYLDSHNEGRGFILIGHSQGAGILRSLIQQRIDGDALADQLIAAYILGSSVAVPENEDAGGDFQQIAACRSTTQTGCVVSYGSFLATSPPPDGAIFGKVAGAGQEALCVNPAAPAGGKAELSSYFEVLGGLYPVDGLGVTDPFVKIPALYDGECMRRNGANILEITIRDDASDVRPDDFDMRLPDTWGMHLFDAHLAMGNIVELASSQIDAYLNP